MDNLINTLKKKDILLKIFMIFLIIQPLLDIYILFSEPVVDFFGFSPSTIIRVIFIAVMAIIAIVTIMRKKEIYSYLLYGLFVVIYAILHYINASPVNSVLPDNFVYSPVSELFYIIRMLIPLIVIVISYKQDLNFKRFSNIIMIVVLLFSGTIVLSNIFKIGLQSYTIGPEQFLQGNIFSWFFTNNTYTFEELTCKGFFYMGNQISALLLFLLPLTLFINIKNLNVFNSLVSFIHIISMIMLSSRVASYGWILVTGAMLIIYFFFTFVKKELRFNKNVIIYFFVLITLSSIVLYKSPILNRTYINDYAKKYVESESINNLTDNLQNLDKTLVTVSNEAERANIIKGFLYKNYDNYMIPKQFIIDIYPYDRDYQFWDDVIKMPFIERGDNRKIQQLITNRIIELNDNNNDRWLGVGFSNMTNMGLYLEKDIVVHYYTIGILGIILFIAPYLAIILASSIICLKQYKKKFNMENITYLLSLVVILGVSYLSGHVLDELIITIYVGFICGQLLRNTVYEEGKHVKS